MIKFASAPVSYGVFGDLTVEGVTTPTELLHTMRTAGYDGSELGPPGFFGTIPELIEAFAAARLVAVGAYVPLHTQGEQHLLDRDLSRMVSTFEEIEAVNPAGLVILADEGSEALLSCPRKSSSLGLGPDGWARLVEVVKNAAFLARQRGLEVSFHPHISTFVELPEEIDRLLDDSDISLTYDIGHVVLAGGDGVELFRRWRERINHVHIKDVRRDVLEQARSTGVDAFDEWWANVATPLSQGDVNLDGFTKALSETDYSGWIVVEQDCAPLTATAFPGAVADQKANLAWLESNIKKLHGMSA